MDAPDEIVEAVAQRLFVRFGGYELGHWFVVSESMRDAYRDEARAVLSVPALAEVIARDANAEGDEK